MRRTRFARLLPLALLIVTACSGGGSSTIVPQAASRAMPDAITQNPPPDVPITATGTITGVIPNEGFSLQTGYPHGTIDVEVTSSTTVSGGSIAAGEPVVVNGTGTFETFILGSSVQVVGLPSVIETKSGGTWGVTPTLWPALGDDTNGGSGQTIDNIPCGAMVDNSFHVHAWLGILDNGVPLQIPPAVGVDGPGPVIDGFLNAGTCFYNIHTHDADGYIHMETLSSEPLSGSLYDLGNVLDIWGEQITPTSLGKYEGQVRVFVSQAPFHTQETPAGGWTEITSMTGLEWDAIQLYSHTAVMIEIGPTFVNAANLPQVEFYSEY
jgi:hypothetical protein